MDKWTIDKLRFVKLFLMFLLCAEVINLLIVISALSFLPAFLHCDKMHSSNFKSLSMRTPKSFCCLLSQVFTSRAFCKERFLFVPWKWYILIQLHIVWFNSFYSKDCIIFYTFYKQLGQNLALQVASIFKIFSAQSCLTVA